eukprot:2695539-Pyramimonas_sp.AAC.1
MICGYPEAQDGVGGATETPFPAAPEEEGRRMPRESPERAEAEEPQAAEVGAKTAQGAPQALRDVPRMLQDGPSRAY